LQGASRTQQRNPPARPSRIVDRRPSTLPRLFQGFDRPARDPRRFFVHNRHLWIVGIHDEIVLEGAVHTVFALEQALENLAVVIFREIAGPAWTL
jgi:hypothetical protein